MRIAIVGYGNVGSSFHRLLEERAHQLKSSYGVLAQVVAVCDSTGCMFNDDGISFEEARAKKEREGLGGGKGLSPLEVISDGMLDVLVECTPSNFTNGEPARTYIERAIRGGVHVITTNKAPLALYMPYLLDQARINGVRLLYSGTVGGGTPFLTFAEEALKGNTVRSFRGILNGTTNFILTRMLSDGLSLNEALEEAKRLGIAETNPYLDLSGLDAAAKLVIMMNHVLRKRVTLKDVEVSGLLEGVPRPSAGNVIKLIARTSPRPSVSLQEISASDPLNVGFTYNAVEFEVEELGSVYLIGKGAGGPETAASIIRDLVRLKSSLIAP